MGNGNSIRAKRRARGTNKEWWRKGPKIKGINSMIIKYEKERRDSGFDKLMEFVDYIYKKRMQSKMYDVFLNDTVIQQKINEARL